jgi:ABC-type multidrug transport system fused ATPase/permease subunit
LGPNRQACSRHHRQPHLRKLVQAHEAPGGTACLAGGQRQRLALARALLADPAVLLLDDWMSALDAETEARIQAALEEFLPDRTCLIVSHRISSVRHARWIVVLGDRRIVEQGTHEQLLAQGGWYAEAMRLQTRSLSV